MALTLGTRLGVYEVLTLIGSGGMGEVYRARDTKLGRDVAIKVLPESVATDPERLARFSREAQMLAALNHPNIAHIHGFEESRGVPALVMELVEGPTLAERIARGPILIDEALPIAKQIAEALEAAYEQGIIHRDLKPANIKVRDDGHVKVLDFGLAKAMEPPEASLMAMGANGITQSPTVTTPAMRTGIGEILGTAVYMAPEQARGHAVDRRVDIWAFGCVLYEMLTRRAPFRGDTVTDVLSSVTRDDPDWQALPANLSPHVRLLLQRCLQKDVRRRLPHIGMARIECDDALDARPAETTVATRRRPSFAFASGAIAWTIVVAGVSIGAAAAVMRRPSVVSTATIRFPILLPVGGTLSTGTNIQPVIAISRDGAQIAYAARVGSASSMLHVRALDRLEPSPLKGTDDASNPLFSPDGRWLAFNTPDGHLKKTPVSGGPVVTICEANGVRGAAWLPDDSIVFSAGGAERGDLWRVSGGGGAPVRILARDPARESSLDWPEVLPDGHTILFAIQRPNADANASTVSALELNSGQRTVLLDGGTMPHYLASGHLLFTRAGVVYAVPFDATTLRVIGAPVPIIDGVRTNTQAGSVQFAAALTGAAVYVAGGETQLSKTLVWMDRHGAVQPLPAPPQNFEAPRLSPDGRQVVLSINTGANHRNVWVYDLERKTLSRLAFEKEEAETPIWTVDGRRIVYAVTQSSPKRVFKWRAADGSGSEQELLTHDRHFHLETAAPDGATFVAMASAPGQDAGSLWLFATKPSPSLRLFLRGPGQIHAPTISPDGHWIAHSANDTGRFEVFIQKFPDLSAKYQISTEGGAEPRWGTHGRELFFRNGDTLMAATVDAAGGDLHMSTPTALFSTSFAIAGVNRDTQYDVSADGQRFFVIRQEDRRGGDSALVVIQNWTAELKNRVPTK